MKTGNAISHRPAVRAVKRLMLVFAAVVAGLMLVAPSAPLVAQTVAPTAPTRIALWQKFIADTEKLLSNPAVTVADLDRRRSETQEISGEIAVRLRAAEARLAEYQALEKALGPAPKPNEAKEPEQAAQKRATIERRMATAAAQAKVLSVLWQESKALLARLDQRRNNVIARRLMREGSSIWRGNTWVVAWQDSGKVREALLRHVETWWANVKKTVGAHATRIILTALLIAMLAALALYLRGRVLDRWGRRREAAPSNTREVTTATLAIAIAGGLLPAALVLGVYIYLKGQGFAGGEFSYVIQGLALAAGLYILFWAFSRAVFAPIVVTWRPLPLTDRQARRLDRRMKWLAVVLALGVFGSIASIPHFVSRELLAAWTTLVTVPAAVLMFMIGRRSHWLLPEKEGEKRIALLRGARLLLTLGAVIVLGAIALDYHRLAEFVLTGALATVGILVGARILRRFVFDGVKLIFKAEETDKPEGPSLGQFWFWLVSDVMLALGAVFLMMLVWSVDIDSLGRLLTNLWSGMKIGNYTISLGDILFGVVIFVVLVAIVRSGQRTFDDRVRTGTRLDTGVRNALRAGIGYAGIVVAAAISITVAGFDLSNLAIIAGALSVGIGFGLQAIVNNFVSGLILLVERPFKEGDWIIAGSEEGIVRKIGIRATEVRTFQNASVIIPNAKLISDPVTNWLFQDRTGRADIKIGVAYGSDTELVREILLACAHNHPLVRSTPEPTVLFRDFGDSALMFDLRFYLNDMYDVIKVPSDIRFEIDRQFRAQGVEIPFPQRDVHIKPPQGAMQNETDTVTEKKG